ncbi:MAG TPA: hypothetical protein VGT07_00315 [Steroidobacteraceae bacterium]|nr:hypothetical protein [Steroidobacteraceae bacterium]
MAADAACAPCPAWAEPAPDAPDAPDFADAPELAERRDVPGAPEVPDVPDVPEVLDALDVPDDPRPCVVGRAVGRPEPPPALPDPGVRPLPVALERAAEPDAEDASSDGCVLREEELACAEREPPLSELEAAGEAGLAGFGAPEDARPLDAGAAGTGSEGSPST